MLIARRYGYAIVAGVRKAPLKVTKKMSAAKVSARCRFFVFVATSTRERA
jgi:hypothetical protein